MAHPLINSYLDKYHTKLSPPLEAQYIHYARSNGFDPNDPTYDGRGWFQAYANPKDPNHNLTVMTVNPIDHRPHFTDYWKTPLHPSFSMQSKYWTPAMGYMQWSPLGNDYGSNNPLRGLTGNILYDESTDAGYTPEGLGMMLNRVLQSYMGK